MRGVDLSGSWCSCETTSDGASVAAILAWGIALVPALMVCAWVVTLWGFSQTMATQMARASETALWPLGGRRIQLVTSACLVLVGTGFSFVALRQAAVSWRKRTA